jgi:hypothetical protein
MLWYAIFDPYPTYWSLLMEDIALVVLGGLSVLMLSVLAAWLIVFVTSIVLLPTYLLGVLQPAIRKIALGLQNEFVHSKSTASNRPIIIDRNEEGDAVDSLVHPAINGLFRLIAQRKVIV